MLAKSPPIRRVAVIGSGVSGLAAAWRISKSRDVVLYEKDARPGGHAHTVTSQGYPAVDTGFIVYNEVNYPNLVAMFETLQVETRPTDMSFAVSLDGGKVEYGGRGLDPLIGRWSNFLRPRFWSMILDLVRFYREAPTQLDAALRERLTLGQFLSRHGYGPAFCEDHILPQAAAIWSAPCESIVDFPAAAFIRFFENHGLLKLVGRPIWRTVVGGSKSYVEKLLADFSGELRLGRAVTRITRFEDRVEVEDASGGREVFDAIVIAAHANEALAMLSDASADEARLLGAFGYAKNVAVLHTDSRLAPKRQKLWSSWNYMGERREGTTRTLSVTYWMNLLQGLVSPKPIFLTLNPLMDPAPKTVLHSQTYDHPLFNQAAIDAQAELALIQGALRTYYCGAYFGSGFHEDGLQAGLWTAEALTGEARPWRRPGQNDRTALPTLGALK